MVRKRQTAADFPPEFLDIWTLAADHKLMLDMGDVGTARNLIQKLYTFRKRLMEESPSIASKFYLVDLRVHDELGNVIKGIPTKVPAKAIIRTYIPAWKEQVREQVKASESGVAFENGKLSVLPLAVNSLVPPALASSDPKEAVDHQAETLSDLGYGTGDGT